MSIYMIRTRTCINNGKISGNLCSHWQQSTGKFKKLGLQLPFNLKSPIKTSSWNQSRWPGKRNLVNSTENISNGEYAIGRLWKPFAFALTVSGVSLTGAAIWQYENIRSQAVWSRRWWDKLHTPKYGEFRQHIHDWWHKLSIADKTFVPICAINLLVFLAWMVPGWQPIMSRYFTCGLSSGNLCWPMLFSVFSHCSILHLGANMFVLHSFCEKAVRSLGQEQFVGFYLSAGVISSFTSLMFKAITKTPVVSIGASGAVMSVLAYVCSTYPHSQLAIIFLPQLKFDARTGLYGIICLDTAGCIFRWGFFDHAAHLGGALFGIFWHYFGYQYVWKKREPLISAYHKLRGPVK